LSRDPLKDAIQLRSTHELDFDFLRVLYRTTRNDLDLVPWTDEAKRAFSNSQFELQDASFHHEFPKADFNVIVIDGVPVGRFVVNWCTNPALIVDISLLPQRRGQGIGTHLIEDVQTHAQSVGSDVALSVFTDNPARRLYERLGFVPVGQHPLRIEMIWRHDREGAQ
jgi:ribosomal protein S18 acetylase RimI-like enzyme